MSDTPTRSFSRRHTLRHADVDVVCVAGLAAWHRLLAEEEAGRCCPLHADAARKRLVEIGQLVTTGRMSASEGALEMARAELTVLGLGTLAARPAPTPITEGENP